MTRDPQSAHWSQATVAVPAKLKATLALSPQLASWTGDSQLPPGARKLASTPAGPPQTASASPFSSTATCSSQIEFWVLGVRSTGASQTGVTEVFAAAAAPAATRRRSIAARESFPRMSRG